MDTYRLLKGITRAILIVCCTGLPLAGCGKGQWGPELAWDYIADSYPHDKEPLVHKRVLISRFTDTRSDIEDNHSWLHMIPLMPFGWFELSRPERIDSLKIPLILFPIADAIGDRAPPLTKKVGQFLPLIDLAQAARAELSASGLFSMVLFTEHPDPNEGDLLLQGHITSTRYWGKVTSYGTSILGTWLWLLGFPLGAVHNELAVEFSLSEPGTDSILWEKSYSLTYDKVPLWFYAPWDFYYSELFKIIMQDVVKDLRSTFSPTLAK